MTGARQCDEIVKVIDEVLASLGTAADEGAPATVPVRPSKVASDECPWAELVRWGVLPRPLVAARS